MTRAVVALCAVALQAAILHGLGRADVVPARARFDAFPGEIAGFVCPEPGRLDPRVEDQLGLTDYLLCDYRRGEDVVSVYVGYTEAQVREGGGGRARSAIHPPEHCLPGSGWDIVSNETVTVSVPGLPETPARVNRLVIAKGEARQLVYFWYQSRGRVIAHATEKLLYLFLDRALRGRADGSLVRLTVPIHRGDVARADGLVEDFLPGFAARLPAHLPR